MNAFKSKYPSFTALLALLAAIGHAFAAPGLSLIQKIYSLASIVPQVGAFIPLATGLGAEITALKAAGVPDMEAGAEVLVNDLAFTSTKAQSIIAAALPVAEQIAAIVSPVQVLVAAIKG